MLKKILASALSVLLISAGAVFGLAAPASAHTGDLNASAECVNGEYKVTYTLTVGNTNLNGTAYWRIGNNSWEGVPTSNAGMSNSVPTVSSGNFVLTTITLPGTATQAPWGYAYTIWTDGFSKGSDGGDIGLNGDCAVVEPIVAKADWGYTPATCAIGETLIVSDANLLNAMWTGDSLLANGTVGPADLFIYAVANPGAVWTDGQDGTFHVVLKGPLTATDCLATASVKPTPPTCSAAGSVEPETMVNAIFGLPTVDQFGHYTIVATATGLATFAPDPDVTGNGTIKTFEGQVLPQLADEDCVATAAIITYQGNCTETGSVEGGAISNAEWGPVTYEDGQYSITAFATGIAHFDTAIDGVSDNGLEQTFTGPIPPTNPEDCNIDGPKKPWVKDEKCVGGQPVDGSIEVKFGELGDKIEFEITGGDLDDTITIEFDDPHKVYLPAGDYTVKAIAIEPWMFGEGEKTTWYVTIDDAKCKVYPDDPQWQGETCVDGETAQGWIEVDYSGYLPNQIQYRITGPNGFNEVVSADGDWTRFDLDAGTYTVSVEPLYDWVKVKGDNFPVEFTITSATNCQCFVPDQVDKQALLLDGDINPVCADAEVEITPPTCLSSGQLKLGDHPMAIWGVPSIVGLHYTVIATAQDGFRFAPGDGVSEPDGLTKTFEGDLPPAAGACGDLTTLALTGGGSGNLPWIAGLALLLGIGGVLIASRRRVDGVPTE